MFADVEELYDALLSLEPTDFVSRHIIEPVPFAFSGDFAAWLAWKRQLAELVDVDPYEIVMTGSAATGYSLNPQKEFKSFEENSDFDCGIISSYYFDVAWRFLRQSQFSWLSYSKRTRIALKSHKDQYVFDGTIATDRILGVLPFGRDWLAATEMMGEISPSVGREVKMRIYKDFDALRNYQVRNVQQLRERIAANLADDSRSDEIPLEED